jgi:hypothetical protein
MENIAKQYWFPVTKIAVLLLVGIALTAEFLPEVQAKIIVIPALVLSLVLGIVEFARQRKFRSH